MENNQGESESFDGTYDEKPEMFGQADHAGYCLPNAIVPILRRAWALIAQRGKCVNLHNRMVVRQQLLQGGDRQ